MSRYDNSGNNGDGNDYDDQKTFKLQKYAAVRLSPTDLNASTHDQYGTSFIINFEDAAVIDGVVFRRDDKPNTWKIFSADKFFNLNPSDGLVYEKQSETGEYSNQMSAQDILDHPRVAGFSESFAGNDYFYTPVGVVIEEAGDIAVNNDLDLEIEDGAILADDASMLLGNNSWVRTFAKKVTKMGDAVINDNGEDPTPRGEPDKNPKYDDHDWLATEDPELREELEGRPMELWVTEETQEWEDGDTTTYEVPNLLDVGTGEFVNIDNDLSDDDSQSGSPDSEKAAADGGTTTADASGSTDTESPDEPSGASDGLPSGVPDHLDNLIDYIARNNDNPTAQDIRNFAENEVDNPDEIDWQAAAEVAQERSD
jgi:hypothetical protein